MRRPLGYWEAGCGHVMRFHGADGTHVVALRVHGSGPDFWGVAVLLPDGRMRPVSAARGDALTQTEMMAVVEQALQEWSDEGAVQ